VRTGMGGWFSRAVVGGGLLALGLAGTAWGDEPERPAQGKEEVPSVSLFDGLRSRRLAVEAEGLGDGRMTLTVTNRTDRKLRVVLPPGLVASGASGQFGGIGGGGGGLGGGLGGLGGGFGGLGAGGLGAAGGGGFGGGGLGGGGFGGGGFGGGGGGFGGGGMGTGGVGGGGGTLPAMFGMMMLGRLVMQLVAPDTWNVASLYSGGMGGMGMGGMGMGGMGMGMGGMGGMGGGFRSVPPSGLPHATLKPRQTRHLATRLVRLSRPDEAGPSLPAKGERLRIGDIATLTADARVQAALRRLAEEKAPQTVAQLVAWRVSGLEWDEVSRLAADWANPQELALARRFVERIDASREASSRAASARLYVAVTAGGAGFEDLARSYRDAMAGARMLGLATRAEMPERPEGPAVACRVRLEGRGEKAEAIAEVLASDERGAAWLPMGQFRLRLARDGSGRRPAADFADALAEGILGRLVKVELSKAGDAKGKASYRIRIANASPLVLNGLAVAGPGGEPGRSSALFGLGLPPRRSTTVPATPRLVERLGLKDGLRAIAADLGGL
jgi:hypothetical protein